ncbi:hypothetical protein SLEP1_g52620 [Rubroshorea leprosula]|uniref:NB-ARC domain-containing protein n=1 Tax=Rubroshorea leprosula TaxID=152421 RepID=A0AAV5M9I9_9ROSI|nr:hypothetical protein SLEP1_g52620 [Rubroshorea leprosula]
MAEIATLILEFIKCVARPTRSCVDNHRNFKENAKDLGDKLSTLNCKKVDVENQLLNEVCSEKQAKKEVEKWVQDVVKINAEIQDVLKRLHSASYFSRARLGKLARKKIDVLDAILKRGSFPEGLVVDKPAIALPLPVENLEGEDSVKKKIWGYLTGNEVRMIGVCGIGGVGKTTIMKHIHNELLKGSRFDKVIWATVSYPLNVVRLRHEIAEAMNEKLQKDDHDDQRHASKLMHLMGKGKYVLILDDVWERFTLGCVGIPPPTAENGCKLVITSRKVDVCKSLGCEIVKVSPLSKEESLKLFSDKVGSDILQVPEEIWKAMVEECAGLPLAIVVIAGSMKGVTDVHEWRHALKELREHVRATAEGSEDEIFERLKFSYDCLQDSNIQNCFLSCSLYAEDYQISKDDLVEQWIDEGFIKESRSRRAMLDEGRTMLNKLENSCLLEKAYSEDTIKMHDVVRDMALRISPQFMVKACMGLTEIPDECEWTKNLEKVSLMDNEISDIPLNMCPNCPILNTLMLQRNSKLTQIPNCFFANMQGIKLLNLSGTSIESLPHSICNLENLTTLLLQNCTQLKHVPCLAKLKALKKLDLCEAGIEVAPEGIDMLVNLQYLDLRCPELVELPTQILSNLSHLQHLTIYSNSTTLKIKGEEVRGLKKLETFQAELYDLQHFNNYVKSNHFKRLSNYQLVVGQVDCTFNPFINNFSKEISLGEREVGGEDSVVLPNDVEELWINRCRKFRSLSDIYSLQKTTELRRCVVTECEEIGCVVDMVTSSSSFINNLEALYLDKLPNLSVVVNVEGVEATSPHIFSNLKSFGMWRCSRMKRLFPIELLQGLQNLEKIILQDCQQMEEIIGNGIICCGSIMLMNA